MQFVLVVKANSEKELFTKLASSNLEVFSVVHKPDELDRLSLRSSVPDYVGPYGIGPDQNDR